jgi:large repetitive protein
MERIVQGLRACLRALMFAATTVVATAVAAQAVTISPATVPNGTAGVPYSQTFTAMGGLAPYVFSNEVGRLPNGLALSTAGALSGTPSPATVPFEVWVTDFNGREARAPASSAVIAYTVAVNPVVAPGLVGQPYTGGISVSGGTPPYVCALAAGSLPPGLTLNADCSIIGTPSVPGSYSFTVNVTDSVAGTASVAVSLDIAAAPPAIVATMSSMMLLILALAFALSGTLIRRKTAKFNN